MPYKDTLTLLKAAERSFAVIKIITATTHRVRVVHQIEGAVHGA